MGQQKEKIGGFKQFCHSSGSSSSNFATAHKERNEGRKWYIHLNYSKSISFILVSLSLLAVATSILTATKKNPKMVSKWNLSEYQTPKKRARK